MSTTNDRTNPVEIEGGEPVASASAWQSFRQDWSFGPTEPRFVAPIDPAVEPSAPESANRDGPLTRGAQRIDVPRRAPVARPFHHFGKRSLKALYEWEGVVEEVKGDGFRARLLPIESGTPDPSRVEFTDFSFDDLADETDIDLVAEGAVFYWTIGKSRNTAGTLTNVSLVRFRRIPPPGIYQQAMAKKEARELLQDLGEA